MPQLYIAYALFALGFGLYFIPLGVWGGVISLLCMTSSWVVALLLRKDEGADSSLIHGHATWVIRSFWLFMLYSLVAIIVFGGIFSSQGDHSVMQDMMMAVESGQEFEIEEIKAMEATYVENNHSLLRLLNITIMGPLVLWVLARLGKGVWFLYKQREINKPKSWII